MKIKNIAFSGFMAAIMLSAGATAANAKIEIASKQYVDNKESTLNTNINNLNTAIQGKADTTALDAYLKTDTAETTYAKKSDVTEVTTTANEAKNAADAAKSAADAAAATANANKTAIGDAESGLTNDVADAKAAAAAADTKAAGAATAAETAKSAADAAKNVADANKTAIGDAESGLTKDVADAKAAATAAQGTADQNKTDLTTLTGRVSANETSISGINDKVGEGELATDAKTIVGAINEINNDVYRKVQTYTKAEVNTEIGKIQAGNVDLKGYIKETTYEEGMAKKADKLTVDAAKAGNIATVDAKGQYQVSDKKLTDFTSMADVTGAITTSLTTGDIKNALDAKADTTTVNTELAKKANSDDVYDKKAVDDKFDTTIPKPEGTCAAESGRCVLSVDAASKNMMWMDVTTPLE